VRGPLPVSLATSTVAREILVNYVTAESQFLATVVEWLDMSVCLVSYLCTDSWRRLQILTYQLCSLVAPMVSCVVCDALNVFCAEDTRILEMVWSLVSTDIRRLAAGMRFVLNCSPGDLAAHKFHILVCCGVCTVMNHVEGIVDCMVGCCDLDGL